MDFGKYFLTRLLDSFCRQNLHFIRQVIISKDLGYIRNTILDILEFFKVNITK